MYPLTKAQALIKMKEGYKVQHQYFTSDEFLHIMDGVIVCENGYNMTSWWYDTRQDSEWKLEGYRVIEGQ